MKNIHILPTDKPSRGLVFFNGIFCIEKGLKNYPKEIYPSSQGYNIYITSDEEIKEGDWCIDIDKKVFKHENHFPISIGQRKIILTTDKDLIKDGVQAISDEFLEWFVKNPSCERVEVENYCPNDCNGCIEKCKYSFYKIIIPKEEPKNPNNQEVMFHEEHKEYFYEDFINGKFVTVWLGKDYIPQEEPNWNELENSGLDKPFKLIEEPKTAWVGILHDKLNEYYPAEYELKDIYQGEGCLPNFPNEELCQIWCDSNYKEVPKEEQKKDKIMERFIANAKQQETLEEAAERYNSQFLNQEENKFSKEDFINGAKWQQERSYSEEDILINIELAMIQGLTLGEYRDLLIQQFKKK